jgi:hypothetical protein
MAGTVRLDRAIRHPAENAFESSLVAVARGGAERLAVASSPSRLTF